MVNNSRDGAILQAKKIGRTGNALEMLPSLLGS